MNKKKNVYSLITLIIFTVISGCATTNTNVAKFGDEYYRENITKSKNHQELKEFLAKNNIKFSSLVASSNVPTGAMGSVVLDGKAMNFTNQKSNTFIRSYMSALVNSELSGFVVNASGQNIYTILYCGDYTHANIGENGSFGKMEYTYFLSNTSEGQRQTFLKAAMRSDCEFSDLLGDVFYKKKIQVSSNVSNAKVSVIPKDKSKPITSYDNLDVILKDMADQAMTSLLTDGEMLQALKDYRLTGRRLTSQLPELTTQPIPSKPEAKATEPAKQNQNVNLEEFKAQCKELGFKVGSTDFGNCVLELNGAK